MLTALKRREFKHIVFETPAYFATLEQAELLGLTVTRVPCFKEKQFEITVEDFAKHINPREKTAVWLTQPRFGIGTNQNIDQLQELTDRLGSTNMLVVDEAGEQNYPSLLSKISEFGCDIIRTRGLIKGIGLNGLRISLVLHPPDWRREFECLLEVVGASVDRYSLNSATKLAETPLLLPSMLKTANEQVRSFRCKLETSLLGSWATPTALENSYIGSILLDLSQLPGGYVEKRKALLLEFQSLNMPVVLAASIGFAFDPQLEAVRMNYFTPEKNITNTGQVLNLAFDGIIKRLS